MQTFYVIVQRGGGYGFITKPMDISYPSTYVVNDEAEITVYWQGRTEAEMVNADALVIPVHTMLMDAALGRNSKGKVS